MRTHQFSPDVSVLSAMTDPIPLLDDEFDHDDLLQAYGEGVMEQGSMLHAPAPDNTES